MPQVTPELPSSYKAAAMKTDIFTGGGSEGCLNQTNDYVMLNCGECAACEKGSGESG